MEFGSIAIGAILLGLCIGPFVVLFNHNRKRKNRLLEVLKENAASRACQIDEHEYCGDFVLGIDKSHDQVFFCKEINDRFESQSVDMNQIQNCRPNIKSRTVRGNHQRTQIIERLELVFVPKNKRESEIRFRLYDEDSNSQLSGELQCMERWHRKITDQMEGTL